MSYTFLNLDADFGGDFVAAVASIGSTPTTLVISLPSSPITVNLIIPSSLTCMFTGEGGLVIAGGRVLTFDSPQNIVAPLDMKVVMGDGKINFANGGEVHFGWWGTEYLALQDAIDSLDGANSGGTVLLSLVKIDTKPNAGFSTVYMRSNVHLRGVGKGSLIVGKGGEAQGAILTAEDVENVVIERIWLLGGNNNPYGQIEITQGSRNITVQDSVLQSADFGIWIKNESSPNPIEHIRLLRNSLLGIKHVIDLGSNLDTGDAWIQYVDIIGNRCHAAGDSGCDCIKLRKRVTDVLIQDNILRGGENYQSGDGIDLFASGNRVTIVGNIIEGNGVQGIDIKTDNDLDPPERYGENQRIVIKSNIIRKNTENGVKIANEGSLSGEWVEWIDVSDNVITANKRWGILCAGRQINICANSIYGNALDNARYGGIRLEGNTHSTPYEISEYLSISDNMITNNGVSGHTNFGIQITGEVRNAQILRNHISNDEALPYSDPAGYQSIGIAIAKNAQGLLLKDNRIVNHPSGDIFETGEIFVDGEFNACLVGDTANSGTGDEDIPLFVAPFDIYPTSALFVNEEDIQPGSSHSENYDIGIFEGGTFKPAFRLEFPISGIGEMVSYRMVRYQTDPSLPPLVTKIAKGTALVFRKEKNIYSLKKAMVTIGYISL